MAFARGGGLAIGLAGKKSKEGTEVDGFTFMILDVPIKKAARDTRNGHYQSTVLNYGLTCGPV